jgi:Leucine-rich repeat (LRR) protein
MTKLEIVYLRSCQLKQIPNLLNIQILDLEHNQISDSISLSTSYIHLNLAKNFISEIILEKNLQLETLNLSSNAITSIDFSNFNENLID